MLTSRIIGAFTLRQDVYAEVEKDASFTTTAWVLVVVVSFLNQLGSFASSDLLSWLIGAIGGTIFAILGFVVGALVINWVGVSSSRPTSVSLNWSGRWAWPTSGR